MTPLTFDDYDVYYLANTFTPVELRNELHAAEIHTKVQQVFVGTPYDDGDRFPWDDFADACQRAIEAQRAAAPRERPAARSGRGRTDAAEVKARTDIVAVISRYTRLRKSGHNRFTGLCPLHDDHNPSLTVYADKQTWHCFGACNTGGDVISFIQTVENTDFRGAVAILEG
jgi:hypothetical protein